MNKIRRDKKAILFFISPPLIWFTLVAIIPIFQTMCYSVLDWNGITRPVLTGLENYRKILGDSLFWRSVKNSLIVAGASVFIQLPIAMFLALILARDIKWSGFYRTVYFIPAVISTTIIAQLFMKIYNPNYGILNSMLEAIGLGEWKRMWLADPKIAMTAVVIPMIWQYIGYHMVLFYSAIKSISPDLLDAAKLDGASNLQCSLRVIIPLVVPMIETSVIFAVIGSVKSFDIVYQLTDGGPLDATQMPTLLMYREAFVANKYGTASVISVFIVAECLVFTVLLRKLFRRWKEE